MDKIISINQGCAVKGRYIFENLRLIEDLINRDENSTRDEIYNGGMLKILDLEKAFDRVEHTYLCKILDKIQLGDEITKWIKILFHNIYTTIQTPYGNTKNITVSRSVRQGCPMSMILFVFSAEPLIRMINADNEIQGIRLDQSSYIKICVYADDTTLFLHDRADEQQDTTYI